MRGGHNAIPEKADKTREGIHTQYEGETRGVPPRGVLQIDERGQYPFDSVKLCAEAVGVKPDDIYRWIKDGKEHHRFRYAWETKEGEKC